MQDMGISEIVSATQQVIKNFNQSSGYQPGIVNSSIRGSLSMDYNNSLNKSLINQGSPNKYKIGQINNLVQNNLEISDQPNLVSEIIL